MRFLACGVLQGANGGGGEWVYGGGYLSGVRAEFLNVRAESSNGEWLAFGAHDRDLRHYLLHFQHHFFTHSSVHRRRRAEC
jgi:hypothetical protein